MEIYIWDTIFGIIKCKIAEVHHDFQTNNNMEKIDSCTFKNE